MYEQSHRDYLLLWLSASSSACHGLVNHYRDNAITYKAQRQKMPENWRWRTRQLLDMQMRQRDVTLMQNTRRS